MPSDQAWPTAQPAFGSWLNGLYGQEVTRPLVVEEVRLPSPPCLWGPELTGSAGWVHGLLAQAGLCWATASGTVLLFIGSMCVWPSSTLCAVEQGLTIRVTSS